MDIVFSQLRVGLFYMDNAIIQRYLEKAKSLIEQGGDWDRRNRLKVYEGVYLLAVRNFNEGSRLILDALPTFTCTELVDNKEFVKYVILASLLSLPRSEIKSKVRYYDINIL